MSTDPPKSQDESVPVPTDEAAIDGATDSETKSSPAIVAGTTKADSEIWQSYIDLVKDQIKEQTNPARRQHAELCLEFVKQHGYPAHGYRFLAHHGITEVFSYAEHPDKNEENFRRIGGSFVGTFGFMYPMEGHFHHD
ncbi:hypothetical protein Daus18300_009823 [Diaporthe australafricana]|uniref:Uncharacterized protein n=1 Tax=Diaporthe australafricana TaxID=127596 RepID=A0ABR3WCV0_9PEZI